jgi:hypothetical protein
MWSADLVVDRLRARTFPLLPWDDSLFSSRGFDSRRGERSRAGDGARSCTFSSYFVTSFSSSSSCSDVVGRRGERSRFGGDRVRRREGVRDAFLVVGAGSGARRPTPLPRTSISSSDEDEKSGRSFECFPLAGGTAFRSIGQDAAVTPHGVSASGFPRWLLLRQSANRVVRKRAGGGAPRERLTGDGVRIHLACVRLKACVLCGMRVVGQCKQASSASTAQW